MNVDDLTMRPTESAIDSSEEALRNLAALRHFNGASSETTLREKAAASLTAGGQIIALHAKAAALKKFAEEILESMESGTAKPSRDAEAQIRATIKDLHAHAEIYHRAATRQPLAPSPTII